MLRAFEKGWTCCSLHDPSMRRGLWYRTSDDDTSLELCAGREGDDEYIQLKVGQTLTKENLKALGSILNLNTWTMWLALMDGQLDIGSNKLYSEVTSYTFAQVVQDCKEQGIEPPKDLDALKQGASTDQERYHHILDDDGNVLFSTGTPMEPT